ncbi:MAG: DEAD/DEAH box helicase [Opitutae bacterium]|nr:DEAD/DEAH box helicase [Opitutae bacterium]
MAKPRPPVVRSVRTPVALAALRTWLAEFNSRTRERGEEYLKLGRVKKVWTGADHFVEAEVAGQTLYAVTLFLTRGEWSSQCSCPMGGECKHAYAAALAWIAEVESGGTGVVAPQPVDEPPPLWVKKTKVPSFREQWTPILAEKLGRPLTDSEGRLLGQLAAMFAEYKQAFYTLYPHSIQQHGFAYAPPPGVSPYAPAFDHWWDRSSAPADPWALWQYLAYDYERHGREIPAVFRPLTNTAPIHAALADRLLQQELAVWRQALASRDANAPQPRANPVREITGLRVRVGQDGGLFIETRIAAGKPWKSPGHKWLSALATARPADFEHLSPAEAALGLALSAEARIGSYGIASQQALTTEAAAGVLRLHAARGALVLPDERPFAIEPDPLVVEAVPSASNPQQLEVRFLSPDGRDARHACVVALQPEPLYLFDGRVWRGPPPMPARALPIAALADPHIMRHLRAAGLRMPASLEMKVRRVALRPQLRCWLENGDPYDGYAQFKAALFARADDPVCEQSWSGAGGWHWTLTGAPPLRRPDDPILEFDLATAQAVSARFADFRLQWHGWDNTWTRSVTKNFPEEFVAWHATLPPGLDIDAAPELTAFFGPPLRASVDFSAIPSDSGRDWFDLTIALRVEDTTLTPEEIALLLKARGKWVSLPRLGWRRLELATASEESTATLDRLGLTAEEVFASGKSATHRLHALQLASEAAALESRDAALAGRLRERAAALAALPPPALPAGLRATLRPYQQEGFQFLAHLSAQGFGGVLADDMGLGKTVQTLAWLLYLAELCSREPARAEGTAAAPNALRALVVCPKSVTHGWLTEATRFAPTLGVAAFTPKLTSAEHPPEGIQLLVANYTQLRLHAPWFQQHPWDAVVLDEGQFIKNPSSQVAAVARALPSRHRLILTGTPIENRLTDLWSLFAFAQPGLLGTQAAFRRQYDEDDPAALARLHRRVRHFLLRRTKAQAAPDLPPRTEDDLVVELEGGQRRLYEAELKRARAQLLGLETDRALDAVRFNILASLLRLRQICCHPALIDSAHRDLPSAKLDALLEQLEELRDEGHQVLVFSQFVEMLEIIRERLVAAKIGHLLLTGATEDRAQLVEEFQRDRTKTVFLLSLKAAGFGLNLTAASYAILYDPWWNPAVEAQAIDRTHRIGQTQPVFAYRLVADNTVEQKIRAMQREKAALAAAVVQEESLASVLDLESLRQILG